MPSSVRAKVAYWYYSYDSMLVLLVPFALYSPQFLSSVLLVFIPLVNHIATIGPAMAILSSKLSRPQLVKLMATISTAGTPPVPRFQSIYEDELVQGRIFWLPRRDQLPPKSVCRAQGRQPVDELIYDHPVIIVSHPAEEPNIVHFHVVGTYPRLVVKLSKSGNFVSRQDPEKDLWQSQSFPHCET